MQAKDESGLTSPHIQIMSGKRLAGDMNLALSGKASRDQSSITLSWNMHPGKGRFVLYRAENEGPLVTYEAFEASRQGFTDKKITPATTYRYMIKYINESTLAISPEIIVKY
ncbi:MAG: fibronectin type III domain-containing protein [Bacteroidales bacterium]|nr:fibronectin type III domain-containing protein [Bacteroidales bacterium]